MKERIKQYISSNRTLYVGGAIWLMLVLLFFSPYTFGGKMIAPVDCVECIFRPFAEKKQEEVHNQYMVDGASQYLPYKWAIKTSWEEDGYMGWNPNLLNGTAIPGNTMLSPGDWHNYLFAFLPYWKAWNISMILQFFIAGCGMLLLLRYCKIPLWGTLLAAISYAFYSQFIMWMYDKWLGTMIWAPYLIWALQRFRTNLVNVPACIFMALAWRGGHMQSCVFIFMLVALVWLSIVWKKEGRWLPAHEFKMTTLSYFLTGVLGAMLSLDVFVDTLPQMGGTRELTFSWGLENLLTIVTFIFPNVFGVPQTIDIGKVMGTDLFDVKYGGGIVFILALVGCFNSKGPMTAKVLFLGGFALVCTPLNSYIYSRSTVVMALGMAWLAAWQLYDLTKSQLKPGYWKRIATVLVVIIALWSVASVVIACYRDSFLSVMNGIIDASCRTAQQMGRREWYGIRAERFLSQILIWDWRNLLFAAGLLLGVYCCYKIRPEGKQNNLWIVGICIITFVDMVVYSYSWVSYSKTPEGDYLYKVPAWMSEFKNHVKDGSVAICNPTGDLDFLCTNHLSTYGIRLAGGYETVLPEHIHPRDTAQYEPEDYAQAGISHVMCDIKWRKPQFPGWKLVMEEKDFHLYENPAFKGRFIINDDYAIKPNWRTCNRICLSVPEGSKSLTLLESYHPGWKVYEGEEELEIVRTERGGMRVEFLDATKARHLLFVFHMPYREWYYSIMLLVALGLVVVASRQIKRLK